MSNESIYLVVKEQGSYSDYTCENIAYFTTHEDADVFVRLQEQLQEINHTSPYRDAYSYSIQVIQHGPYCDDAEQQIEAAKAARKQREDEKAAAERARVAELESKFNDATTAKMREVYEFLLWFKKNNNDPFFNAKLPFKLRDVRKTMESYVAETQDQEVVNWMSNYKYLFQHI